MKARRGRIDSPACLLSCCGVLGEEAPFSDLFKGPTWFRDSSKFRVESIGEQWGVLCKMECGVPEL